MTYLAGQSVSVAATAVLAMSLLTSCATSELSRVPQIRQADGVAVIRPAEQDTLKVMTLNLAHGRGTAFHQLLEPASAAVEALAEISVLLEQATPDVIALQEADGPSFWSGDFNHVEYLARQGPFPNYVQAAHVEGLGLSYGTALMSRLELSDPRAVTFDPAVSPMPKGFVVSSVRWPGRDDIIVDVVSVHLDFLSEAARQKQADELIELLRGRNRLTVVMGDLNAVWAGRDSTVRYLARHLHLKAYQPGNRELVTFPALDKRIDWILVSQGLEFHSHVILDDEVSDHRGVMAELRLAPGLGNSQAEAAAAASATRFSYASRAM